jgi:hypothetical protein
MANDAGVKIRRSSKFRSAFTLLELILALSLSVIVVMTITMAINLYWKQFNIRRTNVEEAQLARALLRHMADDLRSAMQYTSADLTGLETVTQNGAAGAAAAAAGLGGGVAGGANPGSGSSGSGQGTGSQNGAGQSGAQPPTGGGQGGSTPMGSGSDGSGQPSGQGSGQGQNPTGGNQGSAAGGSTGAAPEATASEESALTVGLYGSATELRLDVSRLPRVDQYEAMLGAAPGVEAVDIPSDIKTVTYFLRSEESADAADTPLSASAPIESATTGRGRGLMRREVDRAISSWASESGGTESSSGQAKLLAEEVVAITFQYFDGTQWLAEWDSDANGGLPLAVEILLIMSDADHDQEDSTLQADTTANGQQPTERTYRLVVRLPTATIPTTDPAAEASAENDATALPTGEAP